MNEISGRPSFHNVLKSIELSGQTISNPIEICCASKEQFGQVGSLLAHTFHDVGGPLQFLEKMGTIDDFNFVEIPEDYVKTITEKMKSSSTGYDNIPIYVFKNNFDNVGPVVLEICTCSLICGIFPKNLKIAKIKCISKKGGRCDVNNYKPIWILPAFLCKILEKNSS